MEKRIENGTRVLTVQMRRPSSDWTEEALASRQWGVTGKVVGFHDSHGLTYEVRHRDKSIGHYEPRELYHLESMYLLVNFETRETYQQIFKPTEDQLSNPNLKFFKCDYVRPWISLGHHKTFEVSSNEALPGWEENPILHRKRQK